jgi:hypothetical protein
MLRTNIINSLAKKHNYQTYLEIGVENGHCMQSIQCPLKFGVDPNPLKPEFVTHKMTSDEFFSKESFKFDIIFIDGLHLSEQVDKDIENSLSNLSEGGCIVLHDTDPINEEWGNRNIRSINWNGDVYLSILKLKYEYPDINYFTVNTDYGVTVLYKVKEEQKNKKKNLDLTEKLTWSYFESNRKDVLNLISKEEFLNLLKI